jgi:hypothetical protein
MTGIPDGTQERCIRTAAFGSFYFRPSKAQFCPTGLWQDLAPSEWMITKFTERAWLNPTSWLVSRTVTDLAGGWDARLSPSGSDDGEYICRMLTKVDRVEFFPDSKCYYRIGNLSSLNHNSERALSSLFLALTLCVQHLLSIDDSPRAKQAGLQFMQDWFNLFYLGPALWWSSWRTLRAASMGVWKSLSSAGNTRRFGASLDGRRHIRYASICGLAEC